VVEQQQADGSVWKFEYLFSPSLEICLRNSVPVCRLSSQEALDQLAHGDFPSLGLLLARTCGGICPASSRAGTRVFDPRGHATTYLLSGGNGSFLRDIRDALGQTTSFSRDATGRLSSTVDPLSRVTLVD